MAILELQSWFHGMMNAQNLAIELKLPKIEANKKKKINKSDHC